MKKYLVLICFLCMLNMYCKKPEPIPQSKIVTGKIYTTIIQHANHNEPKILYWYVVPTKYEKGIQNFKYITNTILISNFAGYTFSNDVPFPVELYKAPGVYFKDFEIDLNKI